MASMRGITWVGKAGRKALNKILFKINRHVVCNTMQTIGRERDPVIYEDVDGGYIRLSSLELIAQEIAENDIPGAVAELGVFRGDFARHINRLFPKKKLYLFDTFTGFVLKDVCTEHQKGYSRASEGNFRETSEELVLSRMPYPQNCIIKKGWFPETTRGLEKEKFAFVSIDADLFEPIYQGLRFFWPKLGGGGYLCARLQQQCVSRSQGSGKKIFQRV